MRLPQICIDRPVLSTVMSLVVVVFGLLSLERLPNRELPDIELPVVTITTVLIGAAPEVIETSVTQVLEDAIVGIGGIRHLSSSSAEQVSQISVEFELSADLNAVAAEVRDRVARARTQLPDEVEEPIVSKADLDQGSIWINLSSPGLSPLDLTTLVETRIKDRLSNLPGVANIYVDGARRHAIRLWIDHHRLTARGLVIADIADALQRENVDLPSGRVESFDREFSVRTPGELRTAEEYNALVLAHRDGHPVRLRDVGRAVVGAENERTIVRIDGQVGLGIGVFKQSKANTIEMARAVRAEVKAIAQELPSGTVFEVVWDTTTYIEHAIRDVTWTIAYAVVLVLLVIFSFLRSLRATIVPAVAIPVSITGTFALFYFLGFTINTMTLMGLTLAVGLVVDDAIVVLENISRWIEQGASRLDAARRGMEEISFAVVAATLSVMAVFLPLAFLSDLTGRLFREFGLAVAGAVAISGFVALTLAPALCARVLKSAPESERSRVTGVTDEPNLQRSSSHNSLVRAAYSRSLDFCLRHPVGVLLAIVAWVGLGWGLYQTAGREFVPQADRGFVTVFAQAPQGSSLAYTDRYHKTMEDGLRALPEVDSVMAIVGPSWTGVADVTSGITFAELKPVADRERSQQQIVDDLQVEFSQYPGLQFFPVNEPTLGISFHEPDVSLIVQGPETRQVAAYGDEIARRARAIPGLINVDNSVRLNKPQLRVEVDREQASDLGVSMRDVATTLQILLGGVELSTFKLYGETYDVIAQLDRQQRAVPADLYGLSVRSQSGDLVPLDSFVSLKEATTAPELFHFDRQRTATVTGYLASGARLGEVLERVYEIAEEVVPGGRGYRIGFSGQSERFYQSGDALLFAYALAVLMVYLVLAAQFESFIHPITVLVAVALSFTGGLLALRLMDELGLANGTINLFSSIGLVMLVGLVSKNSILIIEFANQLRARGLDPKEAVFEAALTRFRPIMMTALSTIAGILPIAIGLGAGGEARAPLGVTVAGGMLFSTLLTFYAVPVVYASFARLEGRAGRGSAEDSSEVAFAATQTPDGVAEGPGGSASPG
jgi:multidrug efflux pump